MDVRDYATGITITSLERVIGSRNRERERRERARFLVAHELISNGARAWSVYT